MDILLIDRFPVCRDALSDILSQRFTGARIAYADGVDSALKSIYVTSPSLVLGDTSTINGGVDGMRPIISAVSDTPVIVMDVFDEPSAAKRAFALGARGYIPKIYSRQLVDAAIAVVAAGGSYFPGAAFFEDDERSNGASRGLSPRQRQTLDLVAEGLSNQEIAGALGISVGTVKLHVHNALSVIGARNRTEAAVWVRNERRQAGEETPGP